MGSSMEALRDAERLLIASPTFLARTGSKSAEEARGLIGFGESNAQHYSSSGDVLKRPLVVLGTEGFSYTRMMQASQPISVAGGQVCLIITDDTSDPEDHKKSYETYWDWVSSVIDEMAATSRSDDFFAFDFQLVIPPWRPSAGERASDDFFESVFMLTYNTMAGA